jgi:hypothetical protein
VAARCDYREKPGDFETQVVRPLAVKLAAEGTVFAHSGANAVKDLIFGFLWLTGGALLVVFATLALLFVAWLVSAGWQGSVVTALAIETLVLAACLAGLMFAISVRGTVSRRGYDAFYGGKLLAKLGRTTEHVFCATELQCGEHVYMS